MSARSRGDDLNLSLTGSQISGTGQVRKSSSSKQLHRPNSASDSRTPKRDGGRATPGSAKQISNSGAHNLSHRSDRSDFSSVSKASSKKGKSPSDDFLALFENSIQPKIKSAAPKTKKPGPNAVKVMWPATPKRSSSDLGLPGDDLPVSSPHQNFFNHHSARSSDDNSEDDFLSSSISKIQALQKMKEEQQNKSNDDFMNRMTAFDQRRSTKENSPNDFNLPSKSGCVRQNSRAESDSVMKNINSSGSEKNANNNSKSSTKCMNGLANNMVLIGKSPRTKASFTSIENSYQNIKHKTPVNQVKEGFVSSNQVGRNIAEDYIQTLNSAATKIQQCFRKYRKRVERRNVASSKAGAAAIRRMMQQKKKEIEEHNKIDLQFLDEDESDKKRDENRKKMREERARQARQQAIQDLNKKREEKREEIKKKAEEEISFLQASGKITKTPMKANIGRKKSGMKVGNKDKRNAKKETESVSDALSTSRSVSTLRADQEEGQFEAINNVNEAGIVQGDGTNRWTEQSGGVSDIGTKSTLNDLLDTIKKLEEEEHIVTPKPQKKNAWLDDLDKDVDSDDNAQLTAEKLQELGNPRDNSLPINKSSFLSDDKLRSIMSFLDEVQVADRISVVDQELSKESQNFEIPPPLVPSADEIAQIENAQAAANEVTSTVLSQRLELDETKRSVSMLQKALNQQRELTVRHAREADKEMRKRLDVQKEEYEETIKRHLSFIDQLIDDKKNLSEKCEQLVKELKTVDKKYQDKIKSMDERHNIEMQKIKDMHEAAEKLRRERWIEEKTKKIKEMTVQGLEPEIQRLIAKHKNELKKIKQIHEAELLESDERAAQRYVRMTEELRDQLAKEKEAACARERELAKQRYEKEMQNEEEAYQQQRRRLHQEVQEEKERVAQQASRQRSELDKLQVQLEQSHSHALTAMKSEFEKAREEQERRHANELKEMQEKLAIEKASWEENYMKRQQTWMLQKERELKDQVRRDRDKEIELVISRLEEDASASREDCERASENKIKRIREKYESEMRDLESSEQQALDKYNEMKARLTEVAGENECLKVQVKQKDQEIDDLKKLTDKMHRERDRVSDIIRQEFADRLVTTDEENKRIKNDMSEMKARHRIELDRCKDQMEEVRKQKDDEMEEVHKRVKQAIVKKEEVVNQLRQQYQAAQKRADHLEGLLQQQRKQLLGK